jgi:3-amino-4-hydroxybenzoic acid synthase
LKNKSIWFDVRNIESRENIFNSVVESIENIEDCGLILNKDMSDYKKEKCKNILFYDDSQSINELLDEYDLIIVNREDQIKDLIFNETLSNKICLHIKVNDPADLKKAVELTNKFNNILLDFKDETKIPLEIVLAEAQNNGCKIFVEVKSNEESRVVFGVLECGADGVVVKVDDLNDVYGAFEEYKLSNEKLNQKVEELNILNTFYAGMGERACLDFTSYLSKDEGILLGSFSNGGILACSETHPLPYMPTRPFRVNAGALQSYVLAPDNRTYYLSDIRAGMEVLVVNTDGLSRRATVGRVKIERRPILGINTQGSNGEFINVFMQADWHVRVFGTNKQPLNITNLKSGDKVLGYTTQSGRHVGVKVNELIIEQ